MKKIPLGLKPYDIWIDFDIGAGVKPTIYQLAMRLVSVRNAIERYINADLEIAIEWFEEYNILIRILKAKE